MKMFVGFMGDSSVGLHDRVLMAIGEVVSGGHQYCGEGDRVYRIQGVGIQEYG